MNPTMTPFGMASVLPSIPVHRLDDRFLEPGDRLRIASIDEWLTHTTANERRIWCHHRAFYLLPTIEFVAWLDAEVLRLTGGRRELALEIGSGNGALGRALGIRRTDSFLQRDNQQVAAWYGMHKQPVVRYGDDVEKLDADAAVEQLAPTLVIGAWMTAWVPPDYRGDARVSMYGPREDRIVKRCHYLHVGNGHVHGKKPIRSLPHQVMRPPGMLSRAAVPEADVVYLWERS